MKKNIEVKLFPLQNFTKEEAQIALQKVNKGLNEWNNTKAMFNEIPSKIEVYEKENELHIQVHYSESYLNTSFTKSELK